MHPLIKVLIGVVLLVVPLALYTYDFVSEKPLTLFGGSVPLLSSLKTVLLGSIPLFVMLIGLFIVWLELDEWRIEKELKVEEEKEKKKEGRKGRKKKK